MGMVTVHRVTAATDSLLDPDASAWQGVAGERIELDTTPLVLQPSDYVQVKWKTLDYGQAPRLDVSAVHNREAVFFRLHWEDPTDDSKLDDTANFPDQAGVMLPIADDAPISEMGLPDKPVNMWLWRADLETPLYVTATGRGTSMRHHESPLLGKGVHREGAWSVVVARPFNVALESQYVVPLAPGLTHKCTFAVWQGSNKERGGLKAYGPIWQPLEVES
jgi:DMSO reductase family type II enzyme heme b subunit